MNIGTKLSVVKTVITSKTGLSLLKGQKHAPTILFAVGVVGFGATVFLASKATLQLEPILDENERKRAEMHDRFELSRLPHTPEDYNPRQYKRDVAALKITFVRDISRLYAPAAIVGLASVGALTGSHVVLNRRYASVVAAYATLDKSYKEYIERVDKLVGPEMGQKLKQGHETREVATEDGSDVNIIHESRGLSPYAVLFAKDTTFEWSPQSDYNLVFLRAQQQIANDLLNSKGYVFLNEIYRNLGLPETPAGQAVGWVKNNKKVYEGGRVGGDNYVSFGIFDDANQFHAFMSGREGALWLDFNVDGVVYDLI